MEQISLIEPTMEYADDIMMFRKEIIEANDGIFEKEVLVDGEYIKRYWISIT